jgi:osmotically-inducible protein OsmY
MNRRLCCLVVGTSVVALISLGCGRGTTESGDKEDKTTASVEIHDAAITAEVKMALAVKRGVSATEINVDTDQGVVTLRGQVESQAERQLAVMVAKDVHGVKDVVNDITVR